jgi:hypothetical protein
MAEPPEAPKANFTSSSTPTSQPTPAGVAEPTNQTSSQRLEFLYKALDDNQNLIRFLDAKAAFAVAVLSAMIGEILAHLDTYFPWGGQPAWRQFLLLVFGFGGTLGAGLVGLIIFPTINPAAHTQLLPSNGPTFFLSQLKPKKWVRILSGNPRFSGLAEGHLEYLHQVSAANSMDIIRVISGEVLKVSYIRQIKTDRLKALALVLAGCTVIFVILMVGNASVPKRVSPALVQVQGPITLNPLPTSALPPTQTTLPNNSSQNPSRGPTRRRTHVGAKATTARPSGQ